MCAYACIQVANIGSAALYLCLPVSKRANRLTALIIPCSFQWDATFFILLHTLADTYKRTRAISHITATCTSAVCVCVCMYTFLHTIFQQQIFSSTGALISFPPPSYSIHDYFGSFFNFPCIWVEIMWNIAAHNNFNCVEWTALKWNWKLFTVANYENSPNIRIVAQICE